MYPGSTDSYFELLLVLHTGATHPVVADSKTKQKPALSSDILKVHHECLPWQENSPQIGANSTGTSSSGRKALRSAEKIMLYGELGQATPIALLTSFIRGLQLLIRNKQINKKP